MTSSLQVIEHLKAQFDASEMADSVLAMMVNLADERKQLVFALVAETGISLKSPVAGADSVKSSRLLELGEAGLFGVQIFADQYVLATALPIDDLSSKDLNQMVVLLAHQADSFQAKLTSSDPY